MMSVILKKLAAKLRLDSTLAPVNWGLCTLAFALPITILLKPSLSLFAELVVIHQLTYFFAQFALRKKIRDSQVELSQLISTQSDKNRYQSVGEFAGLVAHDLTNPIHVSKHCIEMIQGNPAAPETPKYLEMLERNVGRTEELVQALRARLKPTTECAAITSFNEAHKNVLTLLATQYRTKRFDSITFNVSPELNSLFVQASKIDLIHILDNLYRNSVENLLNNKIEQPQITVKLNTTTPTHHEVLIRDNGTGLSKKQFEELTTFGRAAANGVTCSMGLRLTRRLIESLGGSLNLVDSMGYSGATYVLKLKKAVIIARAEALAKEKQIGI